MSLAYTIGTMHTDEPAITASGKLVQIWTEFSVTTSAVGNVSPFLSEGEQIQYFHGTSDGGLLTTDGTRLVRRDGQGKNPNLASL